MKWPMSEKDHVEGFHASDEEQILISSQLQGKFGHQVGV